MKLADVKIRKSLYWTVTAIAAVFAISAPAMVIYGLFRMWEPLGWIAAGVVALAIALTLSYIKPEAEKNVAAAKTEAAQRTGEAEKEKAKP